MQPESQWTEPRPECPEPWRWSAPDPWAPEIEVSTFMGVLCYLLKPKLAVETAAGRGATAEIMAKQIRANRVGHLVCIEKDPELIPVLEERLAGLPVTVISGKVMDWKDDRTIDLAFIDGGPELDREHEFMAIAARLRGPAVFHDAASNHQTRQVVDALAARGALERIYLETPRGVALTTSRLRGAA